MTKSFAKIANAKNKMGKICYWLCYWFMMGVDFVMGVDFISFAIFFLFLFFALSDFKNTSACSFLATKKVYYLLHYIINICMLHSLKIKTKCQS